MMGLLVVPLAGTWIEINLNKVIDAELRVVPLAGTWIEITLSTRICGKRFRSSPSRGRGLKYVRCYGTYNQ